jgi:hypothetical protein
VEKIAQHNPASSDAASVQLVGLAVRRGIAWLEGNIQHDGALAGAKGFLAYYKLPLLLAVMKHPAYERCRAHILSLPLGAYGNYETDGSEGYLRHCPSYRLCWLGAGLVRTSGAEFARSLPAYATARELWLQEAERREADLLTAALHGLVAMLHNEVDASRVCQEYLVEVLGNNPVLPIPVSQRRSPGALQLPTEDEKWLRVDVQVTEAKTYILGFVCCFLAEFYIRTKDEASLRTAISLFDLLSHWPSGALCHPYTGKIGMAASSLYCATGRPEYLEKARTSLTYILAMQAENGAWLLREKYGRIEKQPLDISFDRTSEYLIFSAAIARVAVGGNTTSAIGWLSEGGNEDLP